MAIPTHGMRINSSRALARVAVIVIVLLASTTAKASAASSFYWYGEGGSTCWQTGQPASSSSTCDSVSAGFLPTPGGGAGGLAHMVEGGIVAQIAISTSGDYCGYYRLGDHLTSQDASNEQGYTGFLPPTPFSSYQEADTHQNVCQAYGGHWGQEIRDSAPSNGCWETCGMNHYVSFGGQGTSDRPWSGLFGSPVFVVSTEADPQIFSRTGTGTDVGAWGYVCPVFKDTVSGNVLEYCLQEWRTKYNVSEWSQERIGTCASSGNTNIDTIQTFFWPGTHFVSETEGSDNTFVFEGSGTRHFEARITKENLEKAIAADNATCKRSSSSNPENYALIGVENGLEGWRELALLGGSTANLELHSEYSPRPPSAVTGSPKSVSETSATLTGTVGPDGVDTHYYFQYGATTNYGATTAQIDAGAGTGTVPASATIAALEAGTTYHYRLVASNIWGTVYGADQTVTTATAPFEAFDSYGNLYVAAEGPNHSLSVTVRYASEGSWHGPYEISGASTIYSAPSLAFDSSGNLFVTAEGPDHRLDMWERYASNGTWYGPEVVSGEQTAYSAPSEAVSSGGNVFVTAEGPDHRFDMWERYASNGTWYGPEVVSGEQTAYSAPSEAFDSSGNLFVTAEGYNHRFDMWERYASNGTWYGPETVSGEETAYSAPSEAVSPGGNLFVTAEGYSHRLDMWERYASNGTWYGPEIVSGEQTAYSAPSEAFDTSGNLWVTTEGANDTLGQTERYPGGTWVGPYTQAGSETTYSATSEAFETAGQLFIAAVGPDNTLNVTVRSTNGSFAGPYEIDGAGTTF